jgi:nicotinamide mononucleotide (NMN) deamidase PncC
MVTSFVGISCLRRTWNGRIDKLVLRVAGARVDRFDRLGAVAMVGIAGPGRGFVVRIGLVHEGLRVANAEQTTFDVNVTSKAVRSPSR